MDEHNKENDKFNIPEGLKEKINTGDEALWDFGLVWVKYMLFGLKMNFGE